MGLPFPTGRLDALRVVALALVAASTAVGLCQAPIGAAPESQPAASVASPPVTTRAIGGELQSERTTRPTTGAAGVDDWPEATEREAVAVSFWPALQGAALNWFAVVVILVLTLRLRPLLSERNLDGLVLAATCLLLALRADGARLPNWAAGHTGQWWSYLLLTVAAGYWLLRGLLCVCGSAARRQACNVSGGALAVLALAGLAIGVHRVATAPLSAGSRDGLVGGLCLSETGQFPYGEVAGHDCRSPWLYAVHAGAARLVPPEFVAEDSAALVAMSWANRSAWGELAWWRVGDFAAARLVNGLLFVGMLLALYVIGRRLHSDVMGVTLATVFCVFPGALECVVRPEIMLPATLLSWSVALALVPGVCGLLATLLLVLAGAAWPWAWLGLPVLLGYFFRNGIQAFGSVVGLLAGTAGIVVVLTWLTPASMPRADGALARAGRPPTYVVQRSEDGVLRVEEREPEDAPPRGWLRHLWRFLVLSEGLRLDASEMGAGISPIYVVDEILPDRLLYSRLEAEGAARAELTGRYRAALEREPVITRFWVRLRTVLEQTWLAAERPELAVPGAWTLWSGAEAGPGLWHTVRRVVKVLVGLLALIVGLVLLRRAEVRPVHLMGGLLAVCSGALLADRMGAVTNLIWLLPAALAVWAGGEGGPPAAGERAAAQETAKRVASRLNPAAFDPAPRITVEDQPK